MDLEKLLDFASEYLSEYAAIFVATAAHPSREKWKTIKSIHFIWQGTDPLVSTGASSADH
jgi:hypothetical protein